MHLYVFGAGPAYTDRRGATGASYLVRTPSTRVLLDIGQGSFPRLAALIDPADLDAVFISHLHPDHFIDLVPLRHYLRWEEPRRSVDLFGPADLANRLDALHATPGFSAESLDFEPLTEGTRRIGDLTVETRKVTHTDESYAFRVSEDQGPGLVYSGDCGVAEDLAPLIRPGDALLSEATFGPGPIMPGPEHLDGPSVGDLAQRTRAGRVLVTHLAMGNDPMETVASVRTRYDGPVVLVEPGFETTID